MPRGYRRSKLTGMHSVVRVERTTLLNSQGIDAVSATRGAEVAVQRHGSLDGDKHSVAGAAARGNPATPIRRVAEIAAGYRVIKRLGANAQYSREDQAE